MCKTLVLTLTLLFASGFALSANADDLDISIGETSGGECARVCSEMWSSPACSYAFWNTKTGMCRVTNFNRPTGLIAGMKIYSRRLGRWMKSTDFTGVKPGTTGTTVPGNPKAKFQRPDLGRVFKSNPLSYGDIHFKQGWYGNQTKTISVDRTYWDAAAGQWVVEGTWGRTSGSDGGRFEFRFDTPCSFSGKWWRKGNNPPDRDNWSGTCS